MISQLKTLSFFLFLFPVSLVAQEYHFNIEIGTSIANFSGDVDSEFSKYRPGLNLGFGIESISSEASSLKFGILYQQKGHRFKGQASNQNDSESYNDNTTLNYLTVPVTFKKYLANRVVAFSGGFYGSLLLSASADLDQTITRSSSSATIIVQNADVQTNFKRNDAGLVMGASYHPFEEIYIEFKSSWGLANIASDNNELNKLRNHSFEFLLGIQPNIKGYSKR